MLAVVSKRLGLQHALRDSVIHLSQLGGPILHVRAYDKMSEAIKDPATASFLVLDLGSCGDEPDLEDYVTQWKLENGHAQLVVVDGMKDLVKQGHLLWALRPLTDKKLVYALDATNPHEWNELILQHPLALLVADVKDDVLNTIDATKHHVPNLEGILRILSMSPKITLVKELVARDDSRSIKARHNRYAYQFTKEGQAPPSELITCFRTLLYAKLKEDGHYTPKTIARFLGFDEPRKVMLSFRERTGLTLAQLDTVPYYAILQIIKSLVVPSDATQSFKEHIGWLAGV